MSSHYDPVATYLQEADDLLSQIEQDALSLDGPDAQETINSLFRAFHTIKGSGAMCGLTAIAEFTHGVESALDRVREGALPVTDRLMTLVLAAADHLRGLVLAARGAAPELEVTAQKARVALEAFVTGAAAGGPAPSPTAAAAPGTPQERAWRIRFRPAPSLLANGGNPLLILNELRGLGPCQVTGNTDAVPRLEELEPDRCYLGWTVMLQTTADRDAIRDVFLFVEDGADLDIEPLPEAPSAPTAAPDAEGLARPAAPREEGGPRPRSDESTVRVPAVRLDRLVNLVGELVMNQSRVAQAANQFAIPELANPVQELERLVGELRDEVLGIRMLPIGTLFGRFRRVVHDLSTELGKQVNLVTEGGHTELDKRVLDQLVDPLVHILRNSLDHGIEPSDQRVAAGKPPVGTIRLVAQHTGSDVVIAIEDDGRGIDRAAVRAKAVEREVIAADAVLTDQEVLGLILLPGFSTARSVTSVSGRGVGMDVVKRQVDALRGSLSITSAPGKGSRMGLTVPLTLAIIEGLLVEVHHEQFIIPMTAVTDNVELPAAERTRHNGRNLMEVRGEPVPYIDLRTAFGMRTGDGPAIHKVVIVQHEDQRVGLVVDHVIGTHQTVIQSLGKWLRSVEVVSGATIMGDGRVALILDIPAIVKQAMRDAAKARVA